MYKYCRHIRTSGGRCRAAALPNQNFCYFHHHQRQQTAAASSPAPVAAAQGALELPFLEDRPTIQIAIGRVLSALASGKIDHRSAGLYLYGIQIAASNLPKDTESIGPNNCVRRVVLTRAGEQIAVAQTHFEDADLNNHKKSCQCDDCIFYETDDPHHPDCTCGQCEDFAEKPADELSENPAALTIQACADDDLAPPKRIVIPSAAEGPAVRIHLLEKGFPILSQRRRLGKQEPIPTNHTREAPPAGSTRLQIIPGTGASRHERGLSGRPHEPERP